TKKLASYAEPSIYCYTIKYIVIGNLKELI
ncbi:unnamed protein product, partial [marine sediment metagenome]